MTLHRLTQRLRNSAIARLAGDTRGAAALELALITPAILALFFGTTELSQAVAVDRKVTITARTLSDLVAQSTTIVDADMTNIFNAMSSIMTPYAASPLKARVSAVNINASGTTATVAWSDAYGTGITARAPNDVVTTIPAALKVANTQLIWSEIDYGYTSPMSYFITGTLTLTDQFYARPRQSSTICRPPTVTTCS
jgi:Flp pilus assembly protein TadG